MTPRLRGEVSVRWAIGWRSIAHELDLAAGGLGRTPNDMEDERLRDNRQNWNERTPIHASSSFYDVEGFKAGRITLTDVERSEVGDVAGKTLLHLQCHFGLDTMSWARLGAKATGVDFSVLHGGVPSVPGRVRDLGIR